MSRYAAGEDAAFADVYDALAPRLYGYLLRQTRNPAEAEDLVQQTFLRIHLNRGRFHEDAETLPWAYAIAHRLLIDTWRKQGRKPPAASAEGPPRPDEVLDGQVLARQLQHEVDRLPDNQRCVFELLKLEGLSLREAADSLGVTVMAVKLRAHRAYNALRVALGDANLEIDGH